MKTNPILSPPIIQSGAQTQNAIRRRWFAVALGGFLFISVCTLSPSSVEAQCKQWDVSGKWTIQQGSFSIPVNLRQNGKTVTGTAKHKALVKDAWNYKPSEVEYKTVTGAVTGTVDGENFDIQIEWPDNLTGVYRGTIGAQGSISGVTYDKAKSSSNASWSSSSAMKCGDVAPAPASAPAGTPVKSSASMLKGSTGFVKPRPATTPSQLPVYSPNANGHDFSPILHGSAKPTPSPTVTESSSTATASTADESSSDNTQDQHKKKKKKGKHHHHDDDDDQTQGND